jgi:outer membrane protein TolC
MRPSNKAFLAVLCAAGLCGTGSWAASKGSGNSGTELTASVIPGSSLTWAQAVSIAFEIDHPGETIDASGGLTWAQAAEEALKNNPSLREARLFVQQGEEGVSIADTGFLPTITANANATRGGGQTQQANGTLLDNTPNSYSGSLNGTWNLFNGFATIGTRAEGVATVRERQAAYEQASAALYLSLGQAFNQLAYDQANIALLQDVVDRYHADTLYQEQEFKAGLTALWTYEKSESDEAGEVWQLNQQRYSLQADQQGLAVLLGRKPGASEDVYVSAPLTVSAEAGDYAAAEEALVKTNPTLAYYRHAADVADAALWVAEGTRYPSVGATANLGESGTGAFEYNPPQDWQWSVGLNVSYEIFGGGAQEAAVTQARLALRQAQTAAEDQEHQLKAALYRQWLAYLSDARRLPSAAMAVQAGEDRYETVGALYQAGREQYLDYEQAESIYSSAQTQELSALLAAAQSQISFRNAVGVTLEQAAHYPAP